MPIKNSEEQTSITVRRSKNENMIYSKNAGNKKKLKTFIRNNVSNN